MRKLLFAISILFLAAGAAFGQAGPPISVGQTPVPVYAPARASSVTISQTAGTSTAYTIYTVTQQVIAQKGSGTTYTFSPAPAVVFNQGQALGFISVPNGFATFTAVAAGGGAVSCSISGGIAFQIAADALGCNNNFIINTSGRSELRIGPASSNIVDAGASGITIRNPTAPSNTWVLIEQQSADGGFALQNSQSGRISGGLSMQGSTSHTDPGAIEVGVYGVSDPNALTEWYITPDKGIALLDPTANTTPALDVSTEASGFTSGAGTGVFYLHGAGRGNCDAFSDACLLSTLSPNDGSLTWILNRTGVTADDSAYINWTVFNNGTLALGTTGDTNVVDIEFGEDAGNIVLNSGAGTAALTIDSSHNSTFTANVKAVSYSATHLLGSTTAPSVASGFGSGASVTANNGTAAFTISVGTSNTGTGTVTMPTATTSWVCSATDVTTTSTTVSQTKVVQTSATVITFQNYSDVSATHAWVDNDVLAVTCTGY